MVVSKPLRNCEEQKMVSLIKNGRYIPGLKNMNNRSFTLIVQVKVLGLSPLCFFMFHHLEQFKQQLPLFTFLKFQVTSLDLLPSSCRSTESLLKAFRNFTNYK